MRRLVVVFMSLVALVVASPAAADTVQVVIRDTGFQPASVTVDFGDVVQWVNEGKQNHQIEANDGSFASPVLRYKSEHSVRFVGPGTRPYHDALNPSLRGTIIVRDPLPPKSGISLVASQDRVVVGNPVFISGAISADFGDVGGQTIELYEKPFGQGSFEVLATVKTDADGFWDAQAKPTILTQYYARWAERKVNSATDRVSVRPRATIAYNRSFKRFTARVFGLQPRAGRSVNLQRLTSAGRWVNVRSATVGLANKAVFTARLPLGAYRYRIFLTVNQAGPGYLGGQSGTLLIGRR